MPFVDKSARQEYIDRHQIHGRCGRDMYIVSFLFNSTKYVDGLKARLEDYSWWFALVRKFAPQADIFEIRCWPGEWEAFATGRRFGEQIENKMTRELVFRGPVTEAFLKHICEDTFDENGVLKWFTLNFKRGEEMLFDSEHYGTEPYFLRPKMKHVNWWGGAGTIR